MIYQIGLAVSRIEHLLKLARHSLYFFVVLKSSRDFLIAERVLESYPTCSTVSAACTQVAAITVYL
jgi:hypothetical protein